MRRAILRRALRDAPLMLAIGGFLAWFIVLGPSVIGGPATYVFVSGTSMEPTLSTGDLVITRRAEAYEVGDIVAFHVPQEAEGVARGGLVIHRVAGGSAATGYVMRGDNRMGDDPWRPMPADIAGRAWIVIPGIAPFLTMLREPAVFGSLMAGITVFLIVMGADDRRRRPADAVRSPIR
jgi:signal peptidase